MTTAASRSMWLQGQLVDVLYGDVALDPPIAQKELCQEGVRVAEAVLKTLTAG